MYRNIFPEEEERASTSTHGPPRSPNPGSSHPLHQSPLSGHNNTTAIQPHIPSALTTFPLHLTTALLLPTLKSYLPNVQDKASRESLLTQVLYAARSLGRLGGEFGLVVAELGGRGGGLDGKSSGADGSEDEEDGGAEEEEGEGEIEEWVAVMKKHRVLAGKLERMAAGGGGGGAGAG